MSTSLKVSGAGLDVGSFRKSKASYNKETNSHCSCLRTNLGFSFQQASLNQSPIMKTSPFLDPGYPTKTLHSMNPGVETLDSKNPGAEILGSKTQGAEILNHLIPEVEILGSKTQGTKTLEPLYPGTGTLDYKTQGAETLDYLTQGTKILCTRKENCCLGPAFQAAPHQTNIWDTGLRPLPRSLIRPAQATSS